MIGSELVILSEREGPQILRMSFVRPEEFNRSSVRSHAIARDDSVSIAFS